MKGMNLPKMSTIKLSYPKHKTASNEHCPNILKQRFNPSQPNKVWVCDFTYLRAAGRFYYLCVILAQLQVNGVDMNASGLSKLEGQIRSVTDIELVALADILEVSIDYLLGRE